MDKILLALGIPQLVNFGGRELYLTSLGDKVYLYDEVAGFQVTKEELTAI